MQCIHPCTHRDERRRRWAGWATQPTHASSSGLARAHAHAHSCSRFPRAAAACLLHRHTHTYMACSRTGSVGARLCAQVTQKATRVRAVVWLQVVGSSR
ncbi:hypothetical protein V8C40DRAFT_234052 [Trichoderma camerunense]